MQDVQRAVERLGSALEDNGMPRMPSRVLAHLMAEDRGQCTAAELAAALRVSPAAVSGAVRFLTQHGLVVKERRPSGRGDVYRLVDGDVWATLIAARHAQFEHYLASLDAAVSLLEPGSPGRARFESTRQCIALAQECVAELAERWSAT
ncbi:helix-turn-helix domain-containing protein [Aeromicrobium sp.]|uniref:GbsR/MarR family transcriptional regulator n=1 Tax=Aeromicrobium sp. TaxID=1871063 RepID=UPI0025C4FFB0|nr:helix-turn-helix domain-containing protein [Aeromicrobium sp.]MCK5891809.1 helix-turn-helix transcriptional regulator [Aeromicrobium sp.]